MEASHTENREVVVPNIALLRRIKQFLPGFARRTFYIVFIQLHFDYCSTIWGKSSHTKTLYKLQNRVILDFMK